MMVKDIEVKRVGKTYEFKNGAVIKEGHVGYVTDTKDDGSKIKLHNFDYWIKSESFKPTGGARDKVKESMKGISDEAKKILGLL